MTFKPGCNGQRLLAALAGQPAVEVGFTFVLDGGGIGVAPENDVHGQILGRVCYSAMSFIAIRRHR